MKLSDNIETVKVSRTKKTTIHNQKIVYCNTLYPDY